MEELDSKHVTTPGLELVVAERLRQINEERYSSEHDDFHHNNGQLVMAAITYALWSVGLTSRAQKYWPWRNRFKPSDRRSRDLTKAAALLVAQIDRILRKPL